MKLTEQLRTGFWGLYDHPFRTFLTTLGIIFGVAAVIAMVSIGAGAEREALEELKRFGTNSIRITAKPVEGERLKDAVKKLARGLCRADAAYLREVCPFLERVVPEKVTEERLYCMGKKPNATVVGVDDGFLEASRLEIEHGRFITPAEHSQAQAVAVLGHGIARDLCGSGTALGIAVQIGKTRFRVIGVMREQAKGKGRLAIKSRDHDLDVYIPLRTTLERFFKWPVEDREVYHQVSGFWITAREDTDLLGVKNAVMNIIKRRHREVEDIEALVPLEILQQSQKTQNLFNMVMAFIAALSLLVGGIGIMNIMLATVHERTREIGVRRALGASQRDIVVQFLTEATLISVWGGLLGIVVGVALSLGISASTGWTTVIPPSSVVLAFGVSVAVGIIFGLFPAMKAARLDPVTALRYE
jgi:putative ABC transport system permease protein